MHRKNQILEMLGIVFFTIVLVAFLANLGYIRGFFDFEIAQLTGTQPRASRPSEPGPVAPSGYTVIGELKPGCYWQVIPLDPSQRPVAVQNTKTGNAFTLVITEIKDSEPKYSFTNKKLAVNDPYPVYDTIFEVHHGSVWVMEPADAVTKEGSPDCFGN